MAGDYNFYLVPNDGCALPATLTKDGATFNIPSGSLVEAAVVSSDHTIRYTEAIEQAEDALGADWSASLLVVEMTADDLVALQGLDRKLRVDIEIQITEPGGDPLTWYFKNGLVEIGHIQ